MKWHPASSPQPFSQCSGSSSRGLFFKPFEQIRIPPPFPSMLRSTSLPHPSSSFLPPSPTTAAVFGCCRGRGSSRATPCLLQLVSVRSWAQSGTAAAAVCRFLLPARFPGCSLPAWEQVWGKRTHPLLPLSLAEPGCMCTLAAVGQDRFWSSPCPCGSWQQQQSQGRERREGPMTRSQNP